VFPTHGCPLKIGLSGFKSVLIGIRLLLENPWNGEAARESEGIRVLEVPGRIPAIVSGGITPPQRWSSFIHYFPSDTCNALFSSQSTRRKGQF